MIDKPIDADFSVKGNDNRPKTKSKFNTGFKHGAKVFGRGILKASKKTGQVLGKTTKTVGRGAAKAAQATPGVINNVEKQTFRHRQRKVAKNEYKARILELRVQKEQLRQQLPNRGNLPKARFLSDKNVKSNLSRGVSSRKPGADGFFAKPKFKEQGKVNLNKSNGGFYK